MKFTLTISVANFGVNHRTYFMQFEFYWWNCYKSKLLIIPNTYELIYMLEETICQCLTHFIVLYSYLFRCHEAHKLFFGQPYHTDFLYLIEISSQRKKKVTRVGYCVKLLFTHKQYGFKVTDDTLTLSVVKSKILFSQLILGYFFHYMWVNSHFF